VYEAAARRVLTLAFVAATITVGGGCSLGFDTFNPVAGGEDGSPGDGGPVESGAPGVDGSGGDDSSEPGMDTGVQDSSTPETGAMCPGMQACLSTASSCGMPCVQAYNQCTSMCTGGGQQQCRNACRATEQMCRSTCVQACVACTTQDGAGCTDNQGCTTASQM
jgi:hypothetical protein